MGVTVSGASVEPREIQDRFGNHVVEFEAAEVARELTVSMWSTMSWTADGRTDASARQSSAPPTS